MKLEKLTKNLIIFLQIFKGTADILEDFIIN